MTKSEILEFINQNPAFYLATTDGGLPRVRGMLLYRADADGIVFHTGAFKDLYRQVQANPAAELCFSSGLLQVRVSGGLEIVQDNRLKDEIASHPTRAFIQQWKDSVPDEDFYSAFIVMRLRGGLAKIWTMEKNNEPCEEIPMN